MLQRITLAYTILIFSVTSLNARDPDIDRYSTGLRRFIEDVLFVVESGDQERRTKRMPDTVTFVVDSTEPAAADIARKKLSEIAQAAGVKLKELALGQDDAVLHIHLGPRKSVQEKAAECSNEIGFDRGATYWNLWNDDRYIERSDIFLALDEVNEQKRRSDLLLESLLCAFGIVSKSDEFEVSCLNDEDPVYDSLQEIDKRLLVFMYKNIDPGLKPADVREIVREKWEKKN